MDKIDIPLGDDVARREPLPGERFPADIGVTGAEAAACYSSQPDPVDNPGEGGALDGPARGTFLDETILLRDPEGASLVTAVIDLFASHRSLRRQRHAVEVENERDLVSCMLAQGLRCQWHRDPPIASYLRKADGYSAWRNKPEWLSGQAISRAAGMFAKAGLVRLQLGARDTSSGYIVTDKLLALALEHGVSHQSLRRSLHREDLVRLKSVKPRATFQGWTRTFVRHDGDRIYFDPTPETEEWRDRLTAYNDFVSAQDIRAPLPGDVGARWVDQLNADDTHTGARFFLPELFRTAVYRVFNDGTSDQPTFDRGGRLVGGWWINAPKEVRARITINGEPTVELDYSACHPRMLYHELGWEAPADPYDIPGIAELEQQAELEPGHYRSGVKWLTQILINGRGRPDLVAVPDDVCLPPDVPIRALAVMIERAHEPIASAFRTGAGLRLMRMEADIALAIVTKAMERGWAALPIHDSFIAPSSVSEELRSLMKEEYQTKIGKRPVIT